MTTGQTIVKSVALVAALFIAQLASAHGGHDHPPLAGHLSYKQNTLHLHASFPNAPVVNQESLLVLEAKDAKTHQPTELNDNIEVVLWMPSMGHGSAPTQVERAVDANGDLLSGVFNVRNVYFIMGGDWEVRVTLTDAQGVQETKSFKLTLDGGHDHGGHH
jgi:hypothetical protein